MHERFQRRREAIETQRRLQSQPGIALTIDFVDDFDSEIECMVTRFTIDRIEGEDSDRYEARFEFTTRKVPNVSA